MAALDQWVHYRPNVLGPMACGRREPDRPMESVTTTQGRFLVDCPACLGAMERRNEDSEDKEAPESYRGAQAGE